MEHWKRWKTRFHVPKFRSIVTLAWLRPCESRHIFEEHVPQSVEFRAFAVRSKIRPGIEASCHRHAGALACGMVEDTITPAIPKGRRMG